jgi:hypothetical protein
MLGRYCAGVLLLLGSSEAYAGFCTGDWSPWATFSCPTTTTVSNVSFDQTIPNDPPAIPVAPVTAPMVITDTTPAPVTDPEVATVPEYIPDVTYVTTCGVASWNSFATCTLTPVTTMTLNPAWATSPVLVDPPTPLVFSSATPQPMDAGAESVPEPGTFFLVGSMTAALAAFRRYATRGKENPRQAAAATEAGLRTCSAP